MTHCTSMEMVVDPKVSSCATRGSHVLFAVHTPGMSWLLSPPKMAPKERRARGAARKKVSILTGNRLRWNRHGEKRRKTWV